MSKSVWPKRHVFPTKKMQPTQKPSCQLNQKITFIQVDLPVQISDLWASLDTDGDGRVRMEARYTRRGRDDPPVTKPGDDWGKFKGIHSLKLTVRT